MGKQIKITPDTDLLNADWTKKTWDLPRRGTPEFQRFLADMDLTEEEFEKLPAAQWHSPGPVKVD